MSAAAGNAAGARRTGIPERKGHPVSLTRMVGLETSVKMIGSQPMLAEILGIEDRSLRDKLSGKRGVSDEDLIATATALEARAARIAAHAAKLRGLVSGAGA